MQDSIIGTRVRVTDAGRVRELGLGTFLQYGFPEAYGKVPSPRILLDSGIEIWGYQCWWEKFPVAKEAPPFTVRLTRPTRLFSPLLKHELHAEGVLIPEGSLVDILRLVPKQFDHRLHVAAHVAYNRGEFYLLVTEMGLPQYNAVATVEEPAALH